MITNYEKLRTPLYSIHDFPNLAQQEQRFKCAGWAHAQARSLWDLWSDNTFLPKSIRTGLDSFEAFDEWEELALAASHYFLLIASNVSAYREAVDNGNGVRIQDAAIVSNQFTLKAHCPPKGCGRRRYGALMVNGDGSIGYHGGQGEQSRLATTDLYAQAKDAIEWRTSFPLRDVSARMCHTINSLDEKKGDCLLVGGRTSPSTPLGDCWLRRNNTWSQAHSLPEPRFRHSATDIQLGDSTRSILVYGGKTNDHTILNSWLLWNAEYEHGWQRVEMSGSSPEARFGAGLGRINENSGILFGGIGRDGTILEDFWIWSLSRHDDGSLRLECTNMTEFLRNASPQLYPYCSRFGATVNTLSQGLVVAGGIIPRRLVPARQEILLLNPSALLASSQTLKPGKENIISAIGLGHSFSGPRPLLTGHVACTVADDQMLLLGGGAVCFPSGTFWTEGTWLLQYRDSNFGNTWALRRPEKEGSSKIAKLPMSNLQGLTPEKGQDAAPIPRVRIESAAQFQQIVANGKPVIIEGLDIGPCTQLWTNEYLVSKVGQSRKV